MNTKRQYEFVHALSKTVLADVYRCHEYHKGSVIRDVAIKIMRDSWKENQQSVSWLRQELSLLQSLHHPTIPKIYEMTAIRGRVALVMEWIDGLDLRSLVQGMRQMKQRIPLKVTLSLIANVAESLDVIYNQAPSAGRAPLRILHGNLKSSNIMVTPQGKVSLLDFGMTPSDIGGRESATREMQYDSMEYMAPERLFFEPQGPASDVYSLATTLFEMLAGKSIGKAPPSEEQHQARVEKYCQHLLRPMPLGLEVKEELADLLSSGMSYDAEKRPMAYEFANRARRMADSISGVDAAQWSQKAIPYFQARLNRGNVEGTLQGSVLSEDTEVFERPIQVDDEDVDTSIMRRGAVADFVEASLDLNPTAVVEMTNLRTDEDGDLSFESTAISEPELAKGASAIPVPPLILKPPTVPSVPRKFSTPPKLQSPKKSSHTAQVNTLTIPDAPRESMEMVYADGSTQTVTSIDIRPQAMAPIVDEESSGLSTKMLLGLFLGGAGLLLTGVLTVVYLFSPEGNNLIVPTIVEQSVDTETLDSKGVNVKSPSVGVRSDSWKGARFQTSIDSKRIKVKCGLLKERGVNEVTLEGISGRECFVEVRTPDREVFRTTVSSVQDGLYVCFDNYTDVCIFQDSEQ
jgi:serine/threonine protein kinase